MRRFFTLLMVMSVAAVLHAQSTFHGNVARTGAYADAGPVSAPSVAWTFQTGGPVVGSPAVVDGVVYVGTSDSARFMALDAKTGRLKFNFKTGAYIFSSAAIAGDLVYFGNHAGRMFAVHAKSGEPAWEFRTEASKADPLKVQNPDGSLNQAAFAPVFGDFPDMYLDFYRFVSVGAVMSSPVVDRGAIYFGGMDRNVYALR